ncbi:MAG: vitamin K epoxide reductase family protein [Planctomycetota bacterium]
MKRGTVIEVVAAVLCFAAAVISYNLVLKHVTGSSGAAWFEAGCSDKPAAGGANCAAVLASPYSYFPPKKSTEADGRPHLPVAFLGLVYYSALLMWLIGVGRPSPRRRRLHILPLLLVGMGLAASVYYMNIMFRVLNEWCPWCVVTHVLNLLIAICLVMMWPKRLKAVEVHASPTPPTHAPASLAVPRDPSGRTILITLVAIAAIGYGELNMLGLKTWKRQAASATEGYKTCLEAVNRIKSDSAALLRNWQAATKHEIRIRPDDPVRTGLKTDATQPTLDVVVFSDFECPSCKRFAAFLEEQAQPLFDGHIKTVFKHYPLDNACNERVLKTVHPQACAAMSMAEAARMLGGNSAFWQAHDYLYEHRDALAQGKLAPDAVAAELHLDPAAFREAMSSQAVATRVAEDIDQAKLCDIKGTPAVFVEGKLVDILAVTEIGFWDKLADVYWQRSNLPRPASTKPKPAPTTPGTPDRKDAP